MSQDATISNVAAQPAPAGTRIDCGINYGLNESFFDQAMDFGLDLPVDSLVPATPLNMDDFLVQDATLDPQAVAGASATEESIRHEPQLAVKENEQSTPPVNGTVASLQQQMAALERLVSTQRANEKDHIQSLEEKVFQLEQKLYQSSEREQRLEVALSVIFEAFKGTGAPQAQPHKPLWRLYMSSTGQLAGPAPVSPAQSEDRPEAVTTNSFLSMSPSLTFATKPAAQTPPDSTYGSTR